MEEQYPKQALDKFRQWHFWWLIVFSALLIVTFVYYIPARFLNQISQKEAEHSEEEIPHDQEENEHMREHMKQGMTEKEMMKHMKEEHKEGMMDGEDMMSDSGEHNGDDHAAASYFEEFDVKEGLAVNLNVAPAPYRVGALLTLNFFVNQKPANTPVFANQLQIEHEKLMHVIGVRSDLNEFFHIHPVRNREGSQRASVSYGIHPETFPERESNPGYFYSDHVFQKPGLYKIWSEIKKDGINYTFGHPEISVIGQGSKSDKPFDKAQGKQVSFERNVVSGDYQISLSMDEPIVKNREADLIFDIHTLTGMEVNTENLLGAKMHLTIIKDDLKQFIHTHPEEADRGHSINLIQSARANGGDHKNSGDETVDFHVIFPEPGLYKIFAQFRPVGINLPSDEALLAAFWIEVQESRPMPISSWTLLLIASIVLIAVLSWGVNKYINVKGAE